MEKRVVIRIVVADDHQIFRDGLKCLLATEPGFQVVGEAGDGLEAVRVATSLLPDVLLLDVAMPHASGLDAVERIVQQAPSVRIILLTASVDRAAVLMAVQRGARGVLLKHHATPLLFTSIRAVMDGQYWLDRDNSSQVIDTMRRPVPPNGLSKKSNRFNLTARELQVVCAVTAGESNREIANRLSVREDTVKHHMSNIFDKLGVFSRVELAVFAINHGLHGDPVPEVEVPPVVVPPVNPQKLVALPHRREGATSAGVPYADPAARGAMHGLEIVEAPSSRAIDCRKESA
jgi:two-component system, NarL family, nitrate/nitrite response regulator NarL